LRERTEYSYCVPEAQANGERDHNGNGQEVQLIVSRREVLDLYAPRVGPKDSEGTCNVRRETARYGRVR
jgi:hypothetical protein